jgi:hypothetical protein
MLMASQVKNTPLRITLFGQVGNWRIDAKKPMDISHLVCNGF